MKVTAKLMVLVLLTTTLVSLFSAWTAIRSETVAFETKAKQEAEAIASQLEAAVMKRWKESRVEDLITSMRPTVYAYDLQVKWVWFDARTDTRLRPRVSQTELPELVPRRAISIHVRDTSGEYVHTYWPMKLDDRMGGLEFTRSADELTQRQRQTVWRAIIVIGATIALGGAVMWLSGIVLVGRPLRRLTEKAEKVGRGDFSSDVVIRSHDEMSLLASSLNQMCAKLKSSQDQLKLESDAKLLALKQLQHADRLRTVGRLASGIAHELGTPLNVVAGRAELIASGQLSVEETVRSAEAIRHESQRMVSLIQQLLDFARSDPPTKSQVDLNRVLSTTIELLRTMARKSNVEIELRPPTEACSIYADANALQQVFTNLIMNAIHATPEGGTVVISIQPKPSDEQVCVEIQDFGAGIAPDAIDHIFEPFFTTKEPGEGTGLGLSICQRIISEHGGRISVDSQVDVGTIFRVYLPCGDKS